MKLSANTAAARSHRVVLDSNILISALIFKGKPDRVVTLAQRQTIQAITSEILLAELYRVLTDKFVYSQSEIAMFDANLRSFMEVVMPTESLAVVDDETDNRVLEAAVAGNCDYIVTGDKLLLNVRKYKSIKILSVSDFVKLT